MTRLGQSSPIVELAQSNAWIEHAARFRHIEQPLGDALASALWRPEPMQLEPERQAAKQTLQSCVPRAITRLERFVDRCPEHYVAYSGGKDSLVCLALLESLFGESPPLVWSDDEAEYPETVAHMDSLRMIAEAENDDFTILQGEAQHAGWFQPWESGRAPMRDPLPGTLTLPGRDAERSRALGYGGVVLGLRMAESRRRRDWLVGGADDGIWQADGEWRCAPIWDWTDAEVWCYIAAHRLPYNAAYDRLEALGVPRNRMRVGPLPLADQDVLREGWPHHAAWLQEVRDGHG